MRSQDLAWSSWEGNVEPKTSVREDSNIIWAQEQMICCPCEVNEPTESTVILNASKLMLFHSGFVRHTTSSLWISMWAGFLGPSISSCRSYPQWPSLSRQQKPPGNCCSSVPHPWAWTLMQPKCSNSQRHLPIFAYIDFFSFFFFNLKSTSSKCHNIYDHCMRILEEKFSLTHHTPHNYHDHLGIILSPNIG